ncbi:hypothetical protein, partial [Nocardia asteroides]|uniref:hypothetical protein n=1 Tax=Nocardia asteroides TaxID=1824 RepID=UPI0036540A6B
MAKAPVSGCATAVSAEALAVEDRPDSSRLAPAVATSSSSADADSPAASADSGSAATGAGTGGGPNSASGRDRSLRAVTCLK